MLGVKGVPGVDGGFMIRPPQRLQTVAPVGLLFIATAAALALIFAFRP